MKLKKKALMSLSIAVGVAILATTAVVGAVDESAYTQVKNAVKSTSAKIAAVDGNYTGQSEIVLLDNGVQLLKATTFYKTDGLASENSNVTESKDGNSTMTYSFNDTLQNIWYDASSDTYIVNQYVSSVIADEKMRLAAASSTNYNTQDPLAQENVKDLERILDAFVGNLKDYVSVVDNADGTRTFSGSLSDTQIPALVNAIASFATKQYLTSTSSAFSSSGTMKPVFASATDSSGNAIAVQDPDATPYTETVSQTPYGLPSLSGDIFVKSVSGTATTGADGVLSEGELTVALSGTDADGISHEITLKIHVTMSDIGTTAVTAPDLTGKKVSITNSGISNPSQVLLTDAFVGTYRNDIVVLRNGTFVKTGTRTLVVESITDTKVTGRYFETYAEGETGATPLSFAFEAINNGAYNVELSYSAVNGSSTNGNLYFDATTGGVSFMDYMNKSAPNVLPRVFD